MLSEEMISVLLLIHVILGGTALLAGTVSIVAPKGRFLHRKSGLVFVSTMLVSALLSMIISVHPNHPSPFLFSIGILTIYFVGGGYLALRYRKGKVNLLVDRCLSATMLVMGIAMIIHPFFFGGINIMLLIFGILGTVFAVIDFRAYRKPNELVNHWLKMHLGKITGGYISAFTAFVVNQFQFGLISWMAPGIIGGIFIAVWMKRVKSGRFVWW